MPERELSSTEASAAIADGTFSVICGLLALLSFSLLGLSLSRNGLAAAFLFVVALMWAGAAFATTRELWSRWWIQAPLLIASFIAVVYATARTGQ